MPLSRFSYVKIIQLCILVLLWSPRLFAQGSGSDLQNVTSLNELVTRNLKFPSGELKDKKSARIIVSMKIGDLGRPDSIFLIEGATEAFNAEVLQIIDLATANWKSEFLENRPAGNEYLWVFTFSASMEGNLANNEYQIADNFLKREKFEKAIEFCSEKIKGNPYQYLWYEKRAEAHRLAGNAEAGQRDYMAAKQIKRKVLVEAEAKAFGRMPIDPGIPGTIQGTNF